MPRVSLVVIGASAGGVQALRRLLPSVPYKLNAAIAIAMHRVAGDSEDRLPALLQKSTDLPVTTVGAHEAIENNHIYIGPPGVHLEVWGDNFALTAGPRENGVRPSIDVLFRTAAEGRGRKVVGVVLSGSLADGTAGLAAIKDAGGCAIVQDPDDALFPDMPRNAMEHVETDAVCKAEEIGRCIATGLEKIAVGIGHRQGDGGQRSPFSCPDCGGVLWELDQSGLTHFLCRTGHSFSPSVLYRRQDEELEAALWSAVRALDERAQMSTRLAERLKQRGLTGAADRLSRQAKDARKQADQIRRTVTDLVFRTEAENADKESAGGYYRLIAGSFSEASSARSSGIGRAPRS